MKIRPVGAELFHADRQTDITKLIVAFRILRTRLITVGNISEQIYMSPSSFFLRNKHFIDTFGKLKNISSQYRLIVNKNKTKYMKCTRRESKLEKLRVGDTQIDQVKSFSYLGSTVNGNSTLEEEIRERIAKGNKTFYANKALFQSKLVSRRSKLKLYQTVIRPISLFHCAFFNSIMDKTPTHALFYSTLY